MKRKATSVVLIIFMICATIFGFQINSNVQAANGTLEVYLKEEYVGSYSNFQDALQGIDNYGNSQGDYVIEVTGDILLEDSVKFKNNVNSITLKSQGENQYKISGKNNITRNYMFVVMEEIEFIVENIIIDGSEEVKAILVGGNIDNIDRPNNKGKLTVGKGAIIQNCKSSTRSNILVESGPAIYAQGSNVSVTIKDGAIIRNNVSPGGGNTGGAVSIYDDAKLIVNNVLFDNNSVGILEELSWSFGGAIEGTGTGDVTIENSIFSNNIASTSGGAVSISQTHGKVYLKNNQFKNNQSRNYGGALNLMEIPDLLLEDNVVDSNTSGSGGGIDLCITDAVLKNNTIANNKIKNPYGGTSGTGAGISIRNDDPYNYRSTEYTVNISGGTISNNKGGDYGGGIAYSAQRKVDLLTIKGVDIIGNQSECGSGIYLGQRFSVNDEPGKVVVENCKIKDNKAITAEGVNTYGGAIYAYYGDVSLKNTELIGNQAKYGGVLYNSNSKVLFENSQMKENNASTGGVLYSTGKCITTFKESTLSNNSADYAGGVYVNKNTEVILDKSTLSNNTAYYGGAAYVVSLGKCEAKNDTVFKDNEAYRIGGAIYTQDFTKDADDDTQYDITSTDYSNIKTDSSTVFTGNQAESLYMAPQDVLEWYPDIQFVRTSVSDNFGVVHPINNYDINLVQNASYYSITYKGNGADQDDYVDYAQKDSSYNIIDSPFSIENYKFIHWNTESDGTGNVYEVDDKFTIQSDIVVYAQWEEIKEEEIDNGGEAEEKEVAHYTVEHYKQQSNGLFKLEDSEKLSGKIGQKVIASPKEYKDFTLNKNIKDTIQEGIVKEDGSLVLKLYYCKNSLTITGTPNENDEEVLGAGKENFETEKNTIGVQTDDYSRIDVYLLLSIMSISILVFEKKKLKKSNI